MAGRRTLPSPYIAVALCGLDSFGGMPDEKGRDERSHGFTVPANLAERGAGTADAEMQEGATWLAALPSMIEWSRRELSLEEVGEPFQPGGQTAWVAPAQSDRFGDVVLKVAARHPEAFDEAKGLQVWDGDGAIRLYDAREPDDATIILVLERCQPGTALSDEAESLQDEVIAHLLERLWRHSPVPGMFRPLSEMCDQWADGCERWVEQQGGRVDAALMREGIALFRALPRSADGSVLLCTDLHAGNVLASHREPWLVIDPKPYVGDPTYDVLQHMLNCPGRLSADPSAFAGRMAALLDLDASRLSQWLLARCVVGAADWPALLEVAARIDC